MDLRAGRLAQHSMHPVDSESCLHECADKVVALDVVKGGSKVDVESKMVNCWRSPQPCTCRSFAPSCSASGPGDLAELPAARGTQEMRSERRSLVAMRPLRMGAVGVVAEPVVGPARFP